MTALKEILFWLVVVGLAAAGLAMNFKAGYDAGFKAAKADGDAALAKQVQAYETERRQAAEQALSALQAQASKLRDEQARGFKLAAELGAKKDELRAVTEKLSGDVQRVTTLYRRALDAQLEPLPPADFTRGFVRVWNSALFGTGSAVSPAGNATSGTDAPGARAGAADDLIAGITRADLLNNHVRNAEAYAVCRAQLNKLIGWNTNNGSK